jgi:hypothetical protein
MSKLGPDGKALFREDGKILKPESYREPKLRPIIERDFSIYKESDVMKEIADIEKKATTNKILFNDFLEHKTNNLLKASCHRKSHRVGLH